MVIPSTPADLLVWAMIAVLLALDWYIGGMAYNRPPMAKSAREPRTRDEGNAGERRAA